MDYKLEIPITSFLGSKFANMAHWTHGNTDVYVHYKGYNSETARWKRGIGQGMGAGRGFHAHSGHTPSQHRQVLASSEAHQTL